MIIKQCCYQHVLHVVLKHQDLSKNKANGLCSSLGIKTPLSEIHLLGNIFF